MRLKWSKSSAMRACFPVWPPIRCRRRATMLVASSSRQKRDSVDLFDGLLDYDVRFAGKLHPKEKRSLCRMKWCPWHKGGECLMRTAYETARLPRPSRTTRVDGDSLLTRSGSSDKKSCRA